MPERLDWDGLDEAGKGKSVNILGYADDGQPEKSDRVATGDLGVAYHLYSHALRHKFTLRVRVPRDAADGADRVGHLVDGLVARARSAGTCWASPSPATPTRGAC